MGAVDLTTGDIKSHLRRLAIPASFGFLFNTLFNVVDTFFAGFLGAEPLAGLSLSFPVFFLVIALSAGIGSGLTALLSIAIGRKKTEEFHGLALAGLSLAFLLATVLFFSGGHLAPFLFELIGAKGEALRYGMEYTGIIFYGSFFFVINNIMNSLLNAQGDTRSYRNALIVGFILNAILDPLLIMGWFGIPNFGITGIALATIFAQMGGTFYLAYRLKKSALFHLKSCLTCGLNLRTIGSILKQGIPSSLNMMTIATGNFIINHYVVRYGGEMALGAYGAAFRIEQLALLPAAGLNIAVLTITGQNFGVKNFDRIYALYRTALKVGVSILTVGILLIVPFADFLVSLFNADPQVVKIGGDYLRVEVFAFFTYIIIFISNSILQGIKKPAFGFYISIFRQVLLPMLLFTFLGTNLGWGIFGVWWGIVFTNWSAAVIAVIFTLYSLKQVRKEHERTVNTKEIPVEN